MAASSLKSTRKTYSFEEREILITLINKYEDIEEKKSDPVSMCKRKSAWSQLAEDYNSMVGPQGVRSAVQLRRCWENMKACKRNREEKKLRRGIEVNQALQRSANSTGTHSKAAMGTDACGRQNASPTNMVSYGGTYEGRDEATRLHEKDVGGGSRQLRGSYRAHRCSKEKGRDHSCSKFWESRTSLSELPIPTGTVGLPPNVVFEPKESEPFTLQSVCTLKPKQTSRDENKDSDCLEKSTKGSYSPIANRLDKENTPERSRLIFKSNGTQTVMSPPFSSHDQPRKVKRSLHREEELHVLALSEAQMKVDIAAMLKEEARIKLEEAHYRKEEARLRMLLFTYKLDRMKED